MKLLRAALPALSVILAAGAAQAADDWEFSVSPYVWGPGIVGDSQVPPDGPSADIDITFKENKHHKLILLAANKTVSLPYYPTLSSIFYN